MRPMTDREMLLMAFGALRTSVYTGAANLKPVTDLIDDHLFPPLDTEAPAAEPAQPRYEDEEHA